MPINQYKIIPAWNNAGNLVNVESIAVPGASKYLTGNIHGLRLDANTSYFVSAGPITENRVTLADGTTIRSGYKQQEWLMQLVGDDALKYWLDTHIGKMTIATKSSELYDTYTNWNAILDRPVIAREQRIFHGGAWWFKDVIFPIKLVGAPS